MLLHGLLNGSSDVGTRQFGGRQFDCANLSASQFVGEPIWRENKNDLPSLALKRQQKSFVMSQRQLKR